MDEKDKVEYIRLKDRARAMEKFSLYSAFVSVAALVACAVLAEKVWKYFLPIGIGAFLSFVGIFLGVILSTNSAIKKLEAKYGIVTRREENEE